MNTFSLMIVMTPMLATVGSPQAGTGLGLATVGTAGADEVGTTDGPFQKAIDTLVSSNGGTVYVFAGSYTFNAPVIALKPVQILCQPGVVVQRATGGTAIDIPLFEFQLDAQGSSIEGMEMLVGAGDDFVSPLVKVDVADFTLERCKIVDDEITPTMAMVQVTGEGSNLTIRQSSFEFRTTSEEILVGDYFGLDIGDGDEVRIGTLIENNTFIFSGLKGGMMVTGIRLVQGRGLRMLGNYFRPASQIESDQGRLRYAVHLDAEVFGSISNNIFRGLGYPSPNSETRAELADAILRVEKGPHFEGHHLAISANHFDSCYSLHNIHLLQPQFYAITGNVMSKGIGGIELVTPTGLEISQGAATVIDGNQFHQMGNVDDLAAITPVYVPTIVADRVLSINLTGNQFTDCSDYQVYFESSVQNCHVASNQFIRGASGTPVVGAPIVFGGSGPPYSDGHLVNCNSAIGQNIPNGRSWASWVVLPAGFPTTNLSNEDNFVY